MFLLIRPEPRLSRRQAAESRRQVVVLVNVRPIPGADVPGGVGKHRGRSWAVLECALVSKDYQPTGRPPGPARK